MKYWVSFGAFQMLEVISDLTLGFILPFYTELKILVILWLVMGTKLLFDTIVNRELSRREKSIDRWLNKIAKCRNEILAILWLELSQCSLKVLSALMSGGLSFLLVKSPEASKTNSPVNSDAEYEDEPMDAVEDGHPMIDDTHMEASITPDPILKIESNNENHIDSSNRVKLENMMNKSVELMESPPQPTLIKLSPTVSRKTAPLVTVRPYRTRSRMTIHQGVSAD